MSQSELDPMDERFEPLAASIGRAVLAAAALEKLLLVDIAQRYADRHGLRKELEQQLVFLERQPAGVLLNTLRELGIPKEIAERIDLFIARRNELVHRFMEDPDVLRAFAEPDSIGRLIERVDALAIEAQSLINEIAPIAFGGAERALGMTLPDLVEAAAVADLSSIDDEGLRETLRILAQLGPEEFETTPPTDDPNDS